MTGVGKESAGWAEVARLVFGVSLGPRQQEAFAWYASELIEWNQRLNLTAIDEPAGIETKHFLDSLSCLLAMGSDPQGRLADVGSGAGFPGLPLKIACPALEVTLIEATGKKAEFCRHIVQGLSLSKVEALPTRAEVVGRMPDRREAYDWAVARSVARLPTLVEFMLPLLKVGGVGIAQKGGTGPQEAERARPALEILGGRVRELIPVHIPGLSGTRFLVVMEKTSITPDSYPRRPGVAAKRALK